MWLSGFAFIVLFVSFPETLPGTILHERAKRIRAFTGDENYKTQVEMDLPEGTEEPTFIEEATEGFINVFRLAFEPAILFAVSFE